MPGFRYRTESTRHHGSPAASDRRPKDPERSGRTSLVLQPLLHRRPDAAFGGVHEPRPHGVAEDEQPVVRPRGGGPFELPWLSVAEKIHFAERIGKSVADREISQQLERRVGGKCWVVAGFEERQSIVITRRV